MTEEVSFS